MTTIITKILIVSSFYSYSFLNFASSEAQVSCCLRIKSTLKFKLLSHLHIPGSICQVMVIDMEMASNLKQGFQFHSILVYQSNVRPLHIEHTYIDQSY